MALVYNKDANNMQDEFSEMLSGYQELRKNIHNRNASTAESTTPTQLKWAIAEADGWTGHYNPNTDKLTWIPPEQTPMEKVPNVMKAATSMSPEQYANVFTPIQWRNTNGVNDIIFAIAQDIHSGNITEQRAEELVKQLAKEKYAEALEATGFKYSHLKPEDKVSNSKAREALINRKGGDYAYESDYLKKLKEGE